MTNARSVAFGVVQEWADSAVAAGGVLEVAVGQRPGELLVTLAGEQKLRVVVSLLAGARTISASAFVVRCPDENVAGVHQFLLQRNARLQWVSFSVDAVGDVYVGGSVPAVGASAEVLDELVGAAFLAADGSFNKLLELGFLTAIRKEWQWRVDRGESTANLAAFRHVLPGASD